MRSTRYELDKGADGSYRLQRKRSRSYFWGPVGFALVFGLLAVWSDPFKGTAAAHTDWIQAWVIAAFAVALLGVLNSRLEERKAIPARCESTRPAPAAPQMRWHSEDARRKSHHEYPPPTGESCRTARAHKGDPR